MKLTVEHVTRYHYDAPLRAVVQSHRLTPSSYAGQTILHWEVSVTGGARGAAYRDGAGDQIEAWTIAGPLDTVEVRVSGEVETCDLSGVLKGHKEAIPPMAYLRDTPLTQANAALSAMARAVPSAGGPLQQAHDLSEAVAAAIRYVPGTSHALTSAAEALALGTGVCQDHAHALIACARDVGLPARYVSGYLFADAEGVPHEAAHAWAEIWIEGLGWVGFDAANRSCPDARYIRLGSGFDAQAAAPIRGVARGPGREHMEVSVRVQEAQSAQQ